MINDFVVQILPAGDDNVHFLLTAVNPPLTHKYLARKRIALATDELDTLRGGNASETLTRLVSSKLSLWLLGEEVTGWLDAALKSTAEDSVRLVLEVDYSLLPTLADLPLELLYFQGGWFALQPRVSAIVHQLQKSIDTPLLPGSRQYPLRVLFVRSNPKDLGGAVPDAGVVCDDVVKLGAERGPNRVEVDLLSREAATLQPAPNPDPWPEFRAHLIARDISALDPPTWQNFRDYLKKTHYDILVYLGHGDLPEPDGSTLPMGKLEFESPDGETRQSVAAEQLKYSLQARPVPVILLAGCLTAAQFKTLGADVQEELNKLIPKMMRGSQGVAQTLVSSEAGVQVAVGMRYKLETEHAVSFLRAFFMSLLKAKPGHVEAAVRAGRNELMVEKGPFPPSWSAPVVFRTRGNEPLFDFLAREPAYELTDDDIRDQEYREAAWARIINNSGPASVEIAQRVLSDTEEKMRGRTAGPVLFVDRVELNAGATLMGWVPVRLYGELAVTKLTATLTASENVKLIAVRSTAALKASGYKLLDISEGGTSEISFSVKWSKAGAPVSLPEQSLIEAQFEVSASLAASYLVSLMVETSPPVNVRPFDNAILVSLR